MKSTEIIKIFLTSGCTILGGITILAIGQILIKFLI